jgi:hypothetical protein
MVFFGRDGEARVGSDAGEDEARDVFAERGPINYIGPYNDTTTRPEPPDKLE